MVNEFKVGDEVEHPDYGAGKIRFYPESCSVCTFKGVTAQVSNSDLRHRNQEKPQHQFQVGDQVAHEINGSGEVKSNNGSMLWVWYDRGFGSYTFPSELRPRNFLSKIAEEQDIPQDLVDAVIETYDTTREMPLVSAPTMGPQWVTVDQKFNEVFKDAVAHGTGVDMASGPDVGFEAIVTPQGFKEFITDTYGIKRDPTTLLEIDSDGLVQIFSIRGSVRSIS